MKNLDSDDDYLLSQSHNDISVSGNSYFSIFARSAKSSEPSSIDLRLRSSLDHITGIDNITIYAFLINKDELLSLLEGSGADLRSQTLNAFTSHYQHNTAKWSFSVVAPNDSVRYTAIEAVVTRYLTLAHATSETTSSNTLWARAGALFGTNTPIASIFITPLATTASTNDSSCLAIDTTTNQNSSNSGSTEVYNVTPDGSTCSYETIDQSLALSPFSNTGHPKRFSFEAQVFAHAAQTIYSISVRLWRDPDGIPMRMNKIAAVGVLGLALNSLFPDLLERNYTMETRFFSQVDSGVHDLGYMKVRFVMKIAPPQARGHLLQLPPAAWRDLIALIRDPLKAVEDHYYAWAIEGDIFGNGTVIGHWQLLAFCY